MIGFSFTQNNTEYVIVLPSITYTSGNKVYVGSQELEILDNTVMASLEAAIVAYQPGGSSGNYEQGYADGEAAMESAIESSQASVAGQYKSKLASEDATIAAADSTDIDGQGTIFSESYSYLKTSAEMQANYNSGYTAGETAVATSQQPIASDYKSLLSGVDQTIAAADPTTAAGQMSIFNESYQYLNTGGGSGTPFTKDDFVQPMIMYGSYIWTDGVNLYYSYLTDQYVFDSVDSIWYKKKWSRTIDQGDCIWSDGTNIYYSRYSNQYVLDIATSTWTTKTWTGLTSFKGYYIWSDSVHFYYSNISEQYVLDTATSTWSRKTWNLYNFSGEYVWNDGTKFHYSSSNYGSPNNYVLDVATSTWTTETWNEQFSFPSDTKLFSNGTFYEFSDIDMSFKPKSNNP